MWFRLVAGALIVFGIPAVQAATLGSDNAANPGYSPSGSGSFNGEDGGAPTFTPWVITTGPTGTTTAGAFIGDSTTLAPGNSGGNINSSGVSFGLYGYNGAYVNAVRYFDSQLLIGQTFTMQIAVNYRNGNKGFDVVDASGNNIFDLNIGGNDYSVNNTGGGTTNLFNMAYDPNTVFTVYITQTSLAGGTWTIVRSGGLSGTQSSIPGFGYQGIAAGINVYNAATTDGGLSQDDLFFNNLAIIPEPSTFVLLTLGAPLLARRTWRKLTRS
ncbi:MAG: hypothetical protein JO354_11040 [Verrucomicrobia bacterium]|nr:hypothetical protein [Verrucomicrobiota bacterium]